MSKVVKPPVLMSRALTFVLAASIAVLATLVFTLYKMAPLTRPEIFFLQNQSRNVNYVLEQENPENKSFQSEYIKGFIRTYIIARNSIENPKSVTIERWNRIVKPWSSPAVSAQFRSTNMYNDVTENRMYNTVCSINFNDGNILRVEKTQRYIVNFERTCFDQNSGRQIGPKSYKIRIAIQSYLDNGSDNTLNYLKDLRNNPLGIQVTEYKVLDAKGTDPLSDTDFYKEGI